MRVVLLERLLLLIIFGINAVLGNHRQTRGLPFPDSSTVGVSKIEFCVHNLFDFI